MSPEVSDLLKRALALPADERAALANSLLESLETTNQPVEEAWDQEVARRIEALKAGKAVTVPWEELHRELTRSEASAQMMSLRRRISELCKRREARKRAWYAEHPEVSSRIQRLYELQDQLERVRSKRLGKLVSAEMNRICDELSDLPKCPEGLTAEEDQELRNALSQEGRLRRGLSRIPA